MAFSIISVLFTAVMLSNPTSAQTAGEEPKTLSEIVELPYSYSMIEKPTAPEPYNPKTMEAREAVLAELFAKGYDFDFPAESFFDVWCEIPDTGDNQTGTMSSLWSMNTLEDGTRACLLTAEMKEIDPDANATYMVMGFVTNLLPPEQIPEVDPFIIVNAQPYIFVRFYWYQWPTLDYPYGRIIIWSYWWYDSHSHPNWFWGVYWWWRVYTKAYYIGMPFPPFDYNWAYWRPWWGFWWHWVYWRHWHWWSTYFPYYP
jgi:hypothetical protein